MDWNARVRTAFEASTQVPEPDVIEELAQHARATYEAARADGCSPDEADLRVAEQIAEWQRDAAALRHRSRRVPVVEPPPAFSSSPFTSLARDISYAARLLRRQPRFALLVISTMALGIGATAVLFSVTYGVLLKPLPWPGGERVVVLKETRGGKPPRFLSFTNAAYLAWRDQAATLEDIAAWSVRTVTLAGAGDPERIRITAGTASLFRVLGARPLIGSLFDEEDEAAPVVVLSEGLWRQGFGGDPGVLGRTVRLEGEPHTIVGVIPDRLAYPDRQSRAWVPFRVRPPAGNYLSMFHAVARLRPSATAAQASAEGTARGRFVVDTGLTTRAIFGGDGPVEISAAPLREALTADVRRPLTVLLSAVGLLLAIATSNVASLQLARAATRRREFAIRAALGASGARVIRQLVIESLLLGLAGGAAGFALASTLHSALPAILPADFPRAGDLTIGAPVVLFTVCVSIITGVLFGLGPARRVRRLNPMESLAEDGASPVGVGGRSSVARARLLIMAAQVAIACVLLVGASLLGRSFIELLGADRGFDPSRVLSARVSMAGPTYTPERRFAVLGQILDRLTAIPGLREAAFTSELPLTPGGSTSAFTLPSPDAAGGRVSVQASPRVVSPRYFSALGQRILDGRSLSDLDTETAQPVAVVNQTFARRFLGDSPVGAKIPSNFWGLEDETQATVIGVVEDVTYVGAADTSQPEMYFSYRQMKGRVAVPVATLLVRAEENPTTFAAMLRSVVRQADDALVPENVMTLEERLLSTSLARPRLYAVLLGSFALAALLVTGVGLFAVLSYTVVQRTRELGVRAALGARRSDLVRIVLRQGIGVTVAGLAAGLLASVLLGRLLATLLYGVTPDDRLTYVVVPVVLLIVAAIACLAPALRAARLEPLRALRS